MRAARPPRKKRRPRVMMAVGEIKSSTKVACPVIVTPPMTVAMPM